MKMFQKFLAVSSLSLCSLLSACGSGSGSTLATPANTIPSNCVATGYAIYNNTCTLSNGVYGGTGVGQCAYAGQAYSTVYQTCLTPCGNGLYQTNTAGCLPASELGIVYSGGIGTVPVGYPGGVYGPAGAFPPVAPVMPYGGGWGGGWGGGVVIY